MKSEKKHSENRPEVKSAAVKSFLQKQQDEEKRKGWFKLVHFAVSANLKIFQLRKQRRGKLL
jgi:hypothetical protein